MSRNALGGLSAVMNGGDRVQQQPLQAPQQVVTMTVEQYHKLMTDNAQRGVQSSRDDDYRQHEPRVEAGYSDEDDPPDLTTQQSWTDLDPSMIELKKLPMELCEMTERFAVRMQEVFHTGVTLQTLIDMKAYCKVTASYRIVHPPDQLARRDQRLGVFTLDKFLRGVLEFDLQAQTWPPASNILMSNVKFNMIDGLIDIDLFRDAKDASLARHGDPRLRNRIPDPVGNWFLNPGAESQSMKTFEVLRDNPTDKEIVGQMMTIFIDLCDASMNWYVEDVPGSEKRYLIRVENVPELSLQWIVELKERYNLFIARISLDYPSQTLILEMQRSGMTNIVRDASGHQQLMLTSTMRSDMLASGVQTPARPWERPQGH